MDADKEGFLRSERSLIQTIGRAARNEKGKVILYAYKMTGSMERAIAETKRRRVIQNQHNIDHNIIPQTIIKSIKGGVIELLRGVKKTTKSKRGKTDIIMSSSDIDDKIKELKDLMKQSAKELDFESAAKFRDEVKRLNEMRLII